MSKIYDLLRVANLTEGEAKVYTALLKKGKGKISELLKISKVSHSKIYDILDRLEKKGLTTLVNIDGVKYYNVSNPNKLLELIDIEKIKLEENKRLIEQNMDLLTDLLDKKNSNLDCTINKGEYRITNLILDIIENNKFSEDILVLGSLLEVLGANQTKNIFKKIAQNSRKLRMLVNQDQNKDVSLARVLPPKIKNPICSIISDEKVILLLKIDEPLAIVIDNEDNFKKYVKYFDLLWSISK